MVQSNHEPQAAAAAILSPGTTAVTRFPNSSGRAPPSVTGMDTSQHPLPLQDQGQIERLAASKEKGGRYLVFSHRAVVFVQKNPGI